MSMEERDRWMTRLLDASLQATPLTERELEERLGWEAGRLGRILDGSELCSPIQLLAILSALGSERGGSAVTRKDRGARMVQELIDRFRKLGYGRGEAEASPLLAATAAEEIERTVDEVVRQAFGSGFREKKIRGGE